MTDPVEEKAEADAAQKALRLQALCLLVAWTYTERPDRLGVWAREIVSVLADDEVTVEARRISLKEGH